ncbi:hypothetical protein ACIQU6_43395 [Streptomyces sp. NPDC090442]|uniref:hypothetical protein n=1 Tax=Streptomyces sp. NPDC090442 TaxID=3365962 RepID=UPI00380C74E2
MRALWATANAVSGTGRGTPNVQVQAIQPDGDPLSIGDIDDKGIYNNPVIPSHYLYAHNLLRVRAKNLGTNAESAIIDVSVSYRYPQPENLQTKNPNIIQGNIRTS